MTCPDCRDRLQQWFDARIGDEPPALCPTCAEWAGAARRLDRGLRLLAPPAPPPSLADRVVAQVVADRRRRRYRVLFAAGAAAVAATLLIAAWSAFFQARGLSPRAPGPAPMAQTPGPVPDVAPPDAPAVPTRATIRDSVAAAGSAVASLTTRTADETVQRTKILLPAVDPSLSKFDLQPPMEPPTHALREAGEGVSAGLEPVADSARRAVGLFLRELPPMDAPKGGL